MTTNLLLHAAWRCTLPCQQVEQNLSSSSGSRPFQASGNFSEYLSKEAAEAPDTPASWLELQFISF